MGKKFNKEPRDTIFVQSMVSAGDHAPMVAFQWGKNTGQLSPAEARQHAFIILEAAAAAEMDSAVVQWAQSTLGMDLQQVAYLRQLMRDDRTNGNLPSCTLNFDGDRLTPNEVRQAALDMLFMAFHTEFEAYLSRFLMQQVGVDETMLNTVINDLREMRGLQRIDEIFEEQNQSGNN